MSKRLILNSNHEIIFSLKTKAFTLIELLVVVAIIALLSAIIVPALRLAKQKGALAVCLMNVRHLTACWYMYQDENDGELVDANPRETYGWIKPPIRSNGIVRNDYNSGPHDPVTDEDEQRGIREGVLYPYIDTVDVFHCPGDNIRKSKYDQTKIFRTYAIAECLRAKYVKKFNRITIPSQRYNFIEEAEGKNWNVGGWYFFALNDPYLDTSCGQDYYWGDPIGINHGNSGVLGFCDGHGEARKWKDSNTVQRVKYYFEHDSILWYGFGDDELNGRFMGDPASGFDPSQQMDLTFMNNGWAYRNPPLD